MATNDPFGGLGGALGGLLGGGVGANGTGGLDGLVKALQEAGLGDQVASWIGTGANQPVTPDQLGQALGPDKVQELASSTGIDVGQLLPMLAAFLPQIIDALTPNGHVPAAGEAAPNPMDAIGGLLKGLGG